MTSFERRLRWTTLPAGTSISGASCSKRTVVPSGERYWNDHWNWAATARIRISVAPLTSSTLVRVMNERTNMTPTRAVGMIVQRTSRALLPWTCLGSSVSAGRRRKRMTAMTMSPSTRTKTPTAIRKTKS